MKGRVSFKDLDTVCCDCTSVLKTLDLSVVNVSCKNCPVSMLKLIAKYHTNPKVVCSNCQTEKNIRNSLGELDCACGQQDMTRRKR
jgi:hypothetical protein